MKNKRLRFSPLLPWFLALLSGGMMSTGFPPFENHWLSWVPWVAFAPIAWALLFLPLPASSLRRFSYGFLLGFVTGATFFLLTLFWISSVAWEGVATLPFYCACYAGIWSLFVITAARPLGKLWLSSWRNFLVAVFGAMAWTGLEWVRGTLFTGFGWNSFGVAFRHNLPILQISDIAGVGGLSFLGVLTGMTIAIVFKRFFEERHSEQRRPLTLSIIPHTELVLTFLLLLLVMAYGMRELLAPMPPAESLSIAAVQGNIPQNHKWDPAFEEAIMQTYLQETKLALALDPDLVIWPEAATPRPLLTDQVTFRKVESLTKTSSADFLIGSLHYQQQPPKDFNAAILLTRHASQFQIYAKTHLVPFGEYIPFRTYFPLFQWIIGDRILGDFDAGPGPKLLELTRKPVAVAPLLCFEDTLGNLVRSFAGLGAELFITLTNDGWFGHSAASEQHLANATLRCAETKIPMLRVANTGVTCLIDRSGKLTETLHAPDGNTFIKGILSTKCKIVPHPSMTFYTRHGDIFAKGCLIITLLIWLFVLLRRWRKSVA